jgi:predicted dehydrogenase
MTLRLGIIGFSEGNGHPFSFGAIVNGYDDALFAKVGWDGIHTYLRARKADEFGVGDVRVTRCWMPDADMAQALASACRIDAVCETPEEMIGAVDAVMILRDDADSHWRLAAPFLKAGVPVFVDKPLCVSRAELDLFEPYLRSGQLMSTSGLRYAGETDAWRQAAEQFGELRLIRASVPVDWPRYGVHMLECAMGALGVRPVAVQRHAVAHGSVAVRLEDHSLLLIDALGATPTPFSLQVFGTLGNAEVQIRDNFTAFRRTIGNFVELVRTGKPAIDPEDTLLVIRTLIAGVEAEPGGAEVLVCP